MVQKDRGGTAQARPLRLQGIQASPLRCGRFRTSPDPSMILVWVFPRGPWELPSYGVPGPFLPPSPLDPERSLGSGFGTGPSKFIFLRIPSSEESGAVGKDPFDKAFVPIRVPSGGRETKEGSLASGPFPQGTSEDVHHGQVDPRSHPFTRVRSPKGPCHGSWVEPWKADLFSGDHPEG
jgi:hypothetical protein